VDELEATEEGVSVNVDFHLSLPRVLRRKIEKTVVVGDVGGVDAGDDVEAAVETGFARRRDRG
jgi:hypothetical protein